jgi:hypothetical protein
VFLSFTEGAAFKELTRQRRRPLRPSPSSRPFGERAGRGGFLSPSTSPRNDETQPNHGPVIPGLIGGHAFILNETSFFVAESPLYPWARRERLPLTRPKKRARPGVNRSRCASSFRAPAHRDQGCSDTVARGLGRELQRAGWPAVRAASTARKRQDQRHVGFTPRDGFYLSERAMLGCGGRYALWLPQNS